VNVLHLAKPPKPISAMTPVERREFARLIARALRR
jgi:hypothetical protein